MGQRDYLSPPPDPDELESRPRRKPLWVTVTAIVVALAFLLSALLPFF